MTSPTAQRLHLVVPLLAVRTGIPCRRRACYPIHPQIGPHPCRCVRGYTHDYSCGQQRQAATMAQAWRANRWAPQWQAEYNYWSLLGGSKRAPALRPRPASHTGEREEILGGKVWHALTCVCIVTSSTVVAAIPMYDASENMSVAATLSLPRASIELKVLPMALERSSSMFTRKVVETISACCNSSTRGA